MPTELNKSDSTLLVSIKNRFGDHSTNDEFFNEWGFKKDTSDV
jgi:hypothetical protein